MAHSSVLILYNQPADGQTNTAGAGAGGYAESDAGVIEQVKAVAAALDRLDLPHRIQGVARLCDLPHVLREATESVIFNLVESFVGREWDSVLVPALLDAYGFAHTGNPTPALMLAYDKWQTKAILRAAGVDCPAGALVLPGQNIAEVAEHLPPAPWIVKPLQADASEGIDLDSVFPHGMEPRLQEHVAAIHAQFRQPALIENFVGGREINVSILETEDGPQALPLAEIDFSAFPADRSRVVGYAAKWLPDSFDFHHTPRIIPAPLPTEAAEAVRRAALVAWAALGCRGYARVDFRLDSNLRPLVLEVNPNPDISPDAGFVAALQASGRSYEVFVQSAIERARYRHQAGSQVAAGNLRNIR